MSAKETGKSLDEVGKEVTQENFYATVRALHEQFMRGEFLQGYMADLLNISRVDLMHLLLMQWVYRRLISDVDREQFP
ncbi:MAG: hypothetical protein IT324_31110 [Anaerolineae bacterium]|nr:hypothetical protein [Anaerolineae bacterium]